MKYKSFPEHLTGDVRGHYPSYACERETRIGRVGRKFLRSGARYASYDTKKKSINKRINLLKPTGYLMHQQL
jgi:hypothetical protein